MACFEAKVDTRFEKISNLHPCFSGGANMSRGRVHLPVSPACNIQCRFCKRSFNKSEQRPGVAGRLLTPEQAAQLVDKALTLCPEITVVGIAGPGDTLATTHALETFRLVHRRHPELENNFTVIFDSAIDEPYKDQYCCSAYVRENIAREYPEIAAKYTRAMQKASAWVQENKDETARIQVENKWVAGDAKINAEVLKTFNYIPSYSQAYDMFGLLAEQLQKVGMLEADVDTKALQQNSFVKLDNIPYQ
ncbi:MAG TPA: hypothetical protein PLD49_01730 [Thermoclostridium caenicola]|uniref:hypothetical protein n=1 Tax=Thermoclostridium caenicola TaxID=659425 RepID=UPI002CD42D81|nr:hypothetical protein [Thermoclostridium caenicola]HOK42374.1 hypothetical protein [Thermoclostridium caenicola]HOL85066.1 hypothetical protein [Thermoclostridium caenicola]HPO77157.1 hypothetical protein [Thermoclostridium caenicola]